MANLATKASVEGRLKFAIHAPLIQWTKAEIIRRGVALGVDYGLTHSCYDPDAAGTELRPLRRLSAAPQGVCRGGTGRPVEVSGEGLGS